MSPDDPRHGRNAGYLAHIFDKETACDPCKAAHAAYKRGLWRDRYKRRVTALYIDPTGTHRRIRALQALGWSYRDINAAAGKAAEHVGGWAHNVVRSERVHVDTLALVKRVYDELSNRPSEGPQANRTRAHAAKQGWHVPAAWDDIDDPTEVPRMGKQRSYYGRDELLAEVAHLTRFGITLERAAEQIGVSVDAIEKAQRRAREVAA